MCVSSGSAAYKAEPLKASVTLHFTRPPDGTLTVISATSGTSGTRIHLHYDNPLGRLTDIKREVDNYSIETLTQYR